MNCLELADVMIPGAVTVAGKVHPTKGSDASQLATATKIVQQGLQVAAQAGAIAYTDVLQSGPVLQEKIKAYVASCETASAESIVGS